MNRPKQQLGEIIREVGEMFNIEQASSVLNISRSDTSKTLSRWTKQGWLSRLKQGLYAVVPIDATTTERTLADPWLLVPELFEPAYIAGWSAAEYWDLTEQIFKDICVVTERPVPRKRHEVHNIKFFLTHIKKSTKFGVKAVWRQERKIFLSDPHKTMIDMLYDPRLGGGIRHVVDCFKQYLKSSHFNPEILGNYAEILANGAVFKRLGFLSENYLGKDHLLTRLCKSHLTKGNIYLDPKIKDGNLVTRWRIFVPANLLDAQ